MKVLCSPNQSRLLRVIARALVVAHVFLSLPQTTHAFFTRPAAVEPVDVVDSFAGLPSLASCPSIAVLILVAADAVCAFVMPADLLRDVVSVVSEPVFANKYHGARSE
ncbi:MAG: hypothetical protein JXO72_08030 [Vicinamibacteria bacterium]|nr:hypothetical protein [Vicinamibacteria bacterium]